MSTKKIPKSERPDSDIGQTIDKDRGLRLQSACEKMFRTRNASRIAENLGVSKTSYHNWTRKGTGISASNLKKIAAAGIDIEQILNPIGEFQPIRNQHPEVNPPPPDCPNHGVCAHLATLLKPLAALIEGSIHADLERRRAENSSRCRDPRRGRVGLMAVGSHGEAREARSWHPGTNPLRVPVRRTGVRVCAAGATASTQAAGLCIIKSGRSPRPLERSGPDSARPARTRAYI